VNNLFLQRIWGEATAVLYRSRKAPWIDLLVLLGLAGLFFGIIGLAKEWAAQDQQAVEIDLSPWALPRYALFSLSRGLIAYLLSLLFTLVYGYWAAKDNRAEKVLIPLLDILQSIPVLGFLPGLVLALIVLFPHSNIGLELAAILMIFTGQVWNMTFSFYHSLRSQPLDQQEVATVYRFSWWQRFKWTELPYATIGLVWNSMMSMAGGWFFLMITEAFSLPVRDPLKRFGVLFAAAPAGPLPAVASLPVKDFPREYRLPGLGSYMSAAVSGEHWNVPAMLWAILAMILMIVLLDQLLWRPVVAWAQKFRVEEGGAQEETSSWFLDWLRHSHVLAWVTERLAGHRLAREARRPPAVVQATAGGPSAWANGLALATYVVLLAGLAACVAGIIWLISGMKWEQGLELPVLAGLTLGRVLLAVALGTLWALPAGLAIGLSPRWSHLLQPVVQVAASFPAPMLYPIVVVGLEGLGISLQWGSVVLMLLGTQWYILFNVIAGAMAVPADLREAARSYRISGWQRFRVLYGPAVFPYLVTGWVTAAGGAWNASIVAEYLTFSPDVTGNIPPATGLGARITEAFARGDFPMLAASVLVMSLLVIAFNRLVWRRLYDLAETRFALNK
jgi:NitT/TauT family transport system permease protein